jgi:hypothetical protein
MTDQIKITVIATGFDGALDLRGQLGIERESPSVVTPISRPRKEETIEEEVPEMPEDDEEETPPDISDDDEDRRYDIPAFLRGK